MMNEVIYLITQTESEYDQDGFKVPGTTSRVKCFASIKSTSYREYYESANTGEIVTDIFVVDERDYNLSMYKTEDGKKIKPSIVEHDGTQYRIVRRYRRSATSGNFTIELTCKEVE